MLFHMEHVSRIHKNRKLPEFWRWQDPFPGIRAVGDAGQLQLQALSSSLGIGIISIGAMDRAVGSWSSVLLHHH